MAIAVEQLSEKADYFLNPVVARPESASGLDELHQLAICRRQQARIFEGAGPGISRHPLAALLRSSQKTAHGLDELPESLQAKAKDKLDQLSMAPEKDAAQRHFDELFEATGADYLKAAECVQKDHDILSTFQGVPLSAGQTLRTNQIRLISTFATVRL